MKNIIDTLIHEGQMSTLVSAINAAGLAEMFASTDISTVFAPNNAAFAKLDPELLKDLLADKDALAATLMYHVVAGKMMSADIAKLTEATTATGNTLAIDTTSGISINAAKVLTADIECDNGVIHVIDTVLQPIEA